MTLVGELAVAFAALFAVRLLSGRLGQSAVPGYVLIGILLGPSTPGPTIFDDRAGIDVLGELGLLLLLFFVGLEFPLRRLAAAKGPVLVGGAIDLVVNAAAGALVGVVVFGTTAAAVLCAGAVYVSSSAVIVQALTDFRRTAADETDLILGVLVFEDVAIAVFVAVAGGIIAEGAVSGGAVAGTLGLVVAFLAVGTLIALGAGRYASARLDALPLEALLLFTFAWLLVAAALSEQAQLSEALGAFVAGVALAGTTVRREIEERFLAVRELFAAAFFFAFGLTVRVSEAPGLAGPLALALAAAIVGKLAAGVLGARATGLGLRRGVVAGLTLVPRGEFSIVVAQLAAGAALVPAMTADRLQAFVGVFVLLAAVVGTLLTRFAPAIGLAAERLFAGGGPAVAAQGGRLSADDLRE